MSLNLNRVMVAGNLTRDPETKFLANENCVASFGLAINRKYKSGSETKEEVTFLDIEAWGKLAELVGKYLTKGRGAYIEGRLKLETWEDKQSGQKRSKIKIVADSVQFLGGKDDGAKAEDAPDKVTHRQVPAPVLPGAALGDDEPPFAPIDSRL